MKREQASRFGRSAAQCVLGGIAIALVTVLCLRLSLNYSTTAFIYLIVIALLSLMGGYIASAVLSIVAAVCLNAFFSPTIFNFRVDYPLDVVALVAFVITSLIVTGLVRGARKQTEAALKAQEQIRRAERELRQLVDVVPQLIFMLDADGHRVYANKALLEHQGADFSLEDYKADEALARLFHPDDFKRFSDARQRGLSRGAPFELEARRIGRHGYRWFLLRFNPLKDEQGRIIRWYGTATDIDDRRRAEDALRKQARLLDLTHDSIFVRDTNDVITYWNHGAQELYGWKMEEAIGRVSHELMQTIFPEPLEQIMSKFLRAGRWEGAVTQTKRDGTQVIVASRWSAQRDEQGRLVATLETNNDMTERKRAEEELHEAQVELAHVTRVTTLGELTASIAHEVNQPLSAIVANGAAGLRWLDRDPPVLEEARGSVEAMISEAKRASEIIQRIHTLSRKTAPAVAPLDINDVIGEVVVLLHRAVLSQGISLRLDLATSLPLVLGDRVQLQQVIINLAMNAIEAMAFVTDRTRNLLIRSSRQDPAGVLVTLVDSGTGIDSEHVNRVFTAFFTTKPGGMGMGLSICRSIIEAHQGRLWASRNAGPGATFQFMLPPHLETRP